MKPKTAIVIPYYQREPGILRRALRSITRQRDVEGVCIVIVDDSSPAPVAAELHECGLSSGFQVTVLEQSNAGPGAARNRGLAHVPPGTGFVAFQDSDDEWAEDHLARALAALSEGYDFFFCDHYQIGQEISAFARAGRIRPEEHHRLSADSDLYAYRGDMFNQILSGNVIATPTVVYDFARFPDMRFREEYSHAGEDYLCWMDFAVRGARFAFSSRPEVRCGTGVNVYAGAKWGTEQHLRRVHNELKYRQATKHLYPVTPDQKRLLDLKIGELREAFARDVLYMLRNGQRIPPGLLGAQLALDPATIAAPITMALRRFGGR